MIISENREKVKRKALSLINKGSGHLSKPEQKFLLEMIMGMLLSGSSNLTEISRTLCEKISVKHTLKRLIRMSSHGTVLDVANQISLFECRKKVSSETVLALDTGDLVHQYGKSFEDINKVFDGSKKQINNGYWLNQVTGYNPSTQETFPLLLDIYSSKGVNFKSANVEFFHLVERVRQEVGNQGLWVMDREYDRGEVLHYFLRSSLNFMIRMKVCRHLIFRNKSHNIKKLAYSINRRIKYGDNCRFGTKKVLIELKGKRHEVTLICMKDKRNKAPMFWLTNGWLKSSKEIKRRMRGYFRRWSVEEGYRFEKQGFGIEKATVRKFNKIRCLLGCTILSWLLLSKINDNAKMRETILKKAKMEKPKRRHRPKFIYYQIQKGVQQLFRTADVIFKFRTKRKERKKMWKLIKKQNLLFPDFYWKMTGVEL